jgi:hypothetical protein
VKEFNNVGTKVVTFFVVDLNSMDQVQVQPPPSIAAV